MTAPSQTAEEAAARFRETYETVRTEVARAMVGQEAVVQGVLTALFAGGHVLLEGVPGLAKTLAVRSLADAIHGKFQRIQFTPDLLPADLIGTLVYQPGDGTFVVQKGPIFSNIILADEINRAPAKVQSALLEAMAERQITVGQTSYSLPEVFMVLGTQNPIEQEGTYHLPEAQLDRFLMQVRAEHPSHEEELQILELDNNRQKAMQKPPATVLSQADLLAMRAEVAELYLDPKLYRYIVDLVQATRNPGAYSEELGRWIRYGASPRASISLARCARALAWLRGDSYVSPEHIQQVAPEILRHRILLNFEAEAEGIDTDDFIQRLLELVAIP